MRYKHQEIQSLKRQIRKDFRDWKYDVNTFNRFDNQSHFLEILKTGINFYSKFISRGHSCFRGRIFRLDEVVKTDKELDEFIYSNEQIFQGYDAEKSGAPKPEKASEGRLNCNGISFLYTSDSEATVVYELRPIKHEVISIAEFKVLKNLRFADCTTTIGRKNNDDVVLSCLLSCISREFSQPHYNWHKYWFTQYLAGQFINLGFDGIIFESSLFNNGKNLVFFYPEDCKAIRSYLVRVDNIDIPFHSIGREELL